MKELLLKLIRAGIAKGASAIIAFVLTAVVTRKLGAEQSGLFLLVFSLLVVLCVLCRLGLDNVIMRYFGADGPNDSSVSSLYWGIKRVLALSLVVALVISLSAGPISGSVFNKPQLQFVLAWMIWALPFMSVFMLVAMAFQGMHYVVLTTLYQNLGLSGCFLIALMSLSYAYPAISLDALIAGKLYAISAIIIFISAFVAWRLVTGASFFVEGKPNPNIRSSAGNLWVSSAMQQAVTWSGVFAAGVFVTAEELAHLSAAQRTAQLASFVLMVVNMVTAPRFAKLWAAGQHQELRRLAKWSTRGMILLVAPVVAVMLLMPSLIMSVFGQGFENGALFLMVLALGQLINVSTGSVGYLLQMSGHEVDYRRVIIWVGMLSLIMAVGFTYMWGALGAAIATASGTAIQNLAALYTVKKRLGFWPIG